jgi:hypothetical protein
MELLKAIAKKESAELRINAGFGGTLNVCVEPC